MASVSARNAPLAAILTPKSRSMGSIVLTTAESGRPCSISWVTVCTCVATLQYGGGYDTNPQLEVLVTHANAPLTPEGRRRLAVLIVDNGWPVRRAAERFQVSPATAAKWAARYRGGLSMADCSSRPRHSPRRCSKRLERRIIKLRYCRRWGAASDQLPPRCSAVNDRPCPGALRDAAAGPHRPSQWPAGAQAQAGPL
jgi:leucine-zipper of insertion element IS481